jgi:hypothetical protein
MTVAKKVTPAKRAPKAAAEKAPAGPPTITFRGRVIAVKLPKSEQLAAWQRLIPRLESVERDNLTGEQALALLNRATKIVDSVIADEVDRDWLEDLRLDGEVELQETLPIVGDAIRALQGEMPGAVVPNRAARRKA